MGKARGESKATLKDGGGSLDALLSSEKATRIIYISVGVVMILLVFRYLQFSTASICCGDFDGYYHIKWSQLLWEGIRSGHFPPAFTWLPLTTLDQSGYVDHHLLFHILQIPFTWVGNLTLGAKISAVLFASIAVFSCYWLILRYRISYPVMWLVALLTCSSAFLYRINMAKAPPIAIVVMVIGIYLLFENKYWQLAPLMFVFVWTYSLFPVLLFAALIWTAVIAWTERRFEWRPVVWTLAGMTAGLVINPYFPRNILLFVEHARMKLTFGEFATKVGGEWYSYSSWEFLQSSFVACVAMVVGYIAFNGGERRRSAHTLFFLVLSTLLMVATMKSKRFAEYWPPFAILFAAFSLQQVFAGKQGIVSAMPADMLDELEPFLDKHIPIEKGISSKDDDFWKTIFAASVTVLLFIIMLFTIKGVTILKMNGVAGEIASSDGPDKYRGGMKWISDNVPAGERIFNTDWDDFPKMFFYDTKHTYISGLDPTYLYDKNKELSKLYDDVTTGKIDDPAVVIRDKFGSRYIFSDQDNAHDEIYAKAFASGWVDKVYEDEECLILHIRDQKGEPPPELMDDGAPDEKDSGDIEEDDADGPPNNSTP